LVAGSAALHLVYLSPPGDQDADDIDAYRRLFILTSAAHAQVGVGWVLHPDFQGRGCDTVIYALTGAERLGRRVSAADTTTSPGAH
jgi:hypothetical protein